MDLHDWRRLSSTEQETRFAAYLASDRRRGFDAGHPPLSRLAVFQLDEGHSQLLWSVHHVAIDGWCLALVLLEVLDRYEAIKSESEPTPPASRPFRHYVGWLQDQDESHASNYWRRVLGDVASATPLGLIEQAQTSARPSST